MNSLINKKVKFQDLGVKDYQPTWDYQEELLKQNLDIKIHNRENPENLKPTDNHLLFVEHPHVYTLGKSGHESNLLANENKLKEIEATYVKVNRGGDITYHGFGQVVGYPILDLENFYTDIHRYMRDLEEVIIRTIAEYGLTGERSPGETGVWFDVGKPYARKICALGVKASRWVTIHGFALNVNTNMKYFDYIIPCGISDKQVTSMQRELEKEVDYAEVKNKIKKHFADVFGCEPFV
ncbi:lipoyl(octanoyl) transferase LipB [Epilithonimonas lactis]|uniref:Octanoyltransferase n=1 Tax=Epilithonimonas lactis TaxID=421072 RepID=A0A085BJN7_9FLAO|nr:lipoyl(octanoyl) transferase LipB [Epilithonimonas lactis]KFC22682.1 octanoyltransferase [Epilithonimonas lactis]SEQ84288.1 lipoyl(octanoyl) transferase [Epilithonimonas lactis]